MKFGNRRAFEKHLQEAAPRHFSPVYLVVIQEDFERKEVMLLLAASLLGDLPLDEYHLKKMDGLKHSASDLLRELGSLSFFAKKRVVVLENAQGWKKEETAKLESYFSQPDPDVYLILAATAVNRATRFYKQVEKTGVIFDLEPQKPWEKEAALSESVSKRFKEEGVHMQPGAAQALVKSVNCDQAQLLQEVDKLLCYLGERKEAGLEDVQMVGTGQAAQTVWQLSDAVFSRRGADALQISRRLIDSGEQVIGLLRALRAQFQTCLMAATAQPEEVQARFPYLRGQMLYKQVQKARQYGAEACRNGLLLIDEAERLAKNSALAAEVLMDTLMIRLVL